METMKQTTAGVYLFLLVRVATWLQQEQRAVWTWEIHAKHRDGREFCYFADHWRQTEGDELPHRPCCEFSFVTTYQIDPDRSGWRVVCLDCGRVSDPCHVRQFCEGSEAHLCDSCWADRRSDEGEGR